MNKYRISKKCMDRVEWSEAAFRNGKRKRKKKKTSRDIINYNITRMSIARYYYNNIYILHYPNGFSTETYYA